MAYTGMVTTWRTLGSAGSPQTLFTLENTTGSAVTVTLRRLKCLVDSTAAITTVMAQLKTFRCAVPTGGTTLTKGTFDSTQSSAANVVARGATASDGGAATAITATPGTAHWQSYSMRLHTAVGQVLAAEVDLLPALLADSALPSFVLRANEAICVQAVGTATNNPATAHYLINCVWSEA